MNQTEFTEQERKIAEKYGFLSPLMNERLTRMWAATEARSLGYGGQTAVHHATGLSLPTIATGLAELNAPLSVPPDRVRQAGSGRKPISQIDPTLDSDLKSLVEPFTRGDPESPLQWISKSLANIKGALNEIGHQVSIGTLWTLLHKAGFSLKGNRKEEEGSSHADRNEQFEYISDQTKNWQAQFQPVISVDCKKKELIGNFKNGGREWRPKGDPELVRVYDFVDPELGKAVPYGIYDVTNNQGFVNVGCNHDTAELAVTSIDQWWNNMGKPLYPEATDLMIACDGGGSNSSRSRLWKVALQRFANTSGLCLHVCHLPPGCSKWNKIEHRLFSYISMNWRGKPLVSFEVIVNLIANTKTEKGLSVQAQIDTNHYPIKIKVSDQMLNQVLMTKDKFHGEWNYTIQPQPT
jgi:hypothetical protein